MGEEPAFHIEEKTAPGPVEAAQAAVGGEDPVTGHDQGQGVGATGTAHGPGALPRAWASSP